MNADLGMRVQEGYLEVQTRYASVFFGRMYRNWGLGSIDGLLVSDYAYSYDHIGTSVGFSGPGLPIADALDNAEFRIILANQAGIDISTAVKSKLERNRGRFPIGYMPTKNNESS